MCKHILAKLLVLRFLFQQSCVAQHLFARRHAEFFENIVVVKFERAFAYIEHIGYFLCGFALQIEVENGFFRFSKLFQPEFEHFVIVGSYLCFTGISQTFDFGLPLSDFVCLVFGYGRKFFVAAFQIFRFEIAEFVLFRKIDE